MNVIEQARQAYAPSHTPLRTPRAVEEQLISEITGRLSNADTDFPHKVAAVHDNRKMWTALAVDVLDPDNGLPAELRAQLFYLAQFTDRHSQKFLRGEADLTPLVDINTAVLRGLRAQGSAA